MVVLGCVVAFPVGGAGKVPRSGGAGCRPWLVLWRCGAAPRGLLVVFLACFSTWAVLGRCGVGPGVPWGGVCGTGVSQPGGCGRVVLQGVCPPLSGPSVAGSAFGMPSGNLVPPPPYFDVAESEYQLRFGGWGGYYRVFGRARAPFQPPHISTPLSQIREVIAFSGSATSK